MNWKTVCEHKFVFLGLVYHYGSQLPGSSARARIYKDRFYCERCLNYQDCNEREVGHTFTDPLPGALPAGGQL